MTLDLRTVGPPVAVAMAAVLGFGLLSTFQSPRTEAVQVGYRGTGMEQVYHRLQLASASSANAVPEPAPATEKAGQLAGEVYQNVQVLRDVDSNEFIRLMSAMSEWIAPEQGCAYCHNVENMADESLYTYKVARRMLQMTRRINADWKPHVGETGVTCYTCHRGQPVPSNIWFQETRRGVEGMAGNPAGQNIAAPAVGLASLPSDPYTPFFAQALPIRVTGPVALPEGNRSSIKQAEWTYGLMMHMSTSLGVNCTFCHNSRQFSDWSQSSPQRVNAWHGIHMLRDLNTAYLTPLQPVYPAERLGPLGDAPKANCATCHQGAYKPLLGVSMLKDHPELAGPSPLDPAAPMVPADGSSPAAPPGTAPADAPAPPAARP